MTVQQIMAMAYPQFENLLDASLGKGQRYLAKMIANIFPFLDSSDIQVHRCLLI
jgi:hypothetical protein